METEIVSIGTKAVQGCIACNRCAESGRCVFGDALYTTVREKLETADGIVIGSPVYYAGPNGSLCALLDRLFYSSSSLLRYKPAACVAVCLVKPCRMPKGCRRCALWETTWHGS